MSKEEPKACVKTLRKRVLPRGPLQIQTTSDGLFINLLPVETEFGEKFECKKIKRSKALGVDGEVQKQILRRKLKEATELT